MSYIEDFFKKLKSGVFILNGKKPWSRGYLSYREQYIHNVLKRGTFDPENMVRGYGHRIDERVIEYPWVLTQLPSGPGRLLDAGSALNHGFLLDHPKLAEKKIYIMTLAPEPVCEWKRGISYLYEDLRNSCFRDHHFDWIVSISTVEHIGLDNTLLYTDDQSWHENEPLSFLEAIKEFHRILKPGGRLYISVPYGKRAHRGWFQVFDANLLDGLIAAFGPSSCVEKIFQYEMQGWKISSRKDAQFETCFDIHTQKTYDGDYAAFSRAIACLELVK